MVQKGCLIATRVLNATAQCCIWRRTQLSETEERECLNKCPLCDMWFLFEKDVSCHMYVEQCCIWGGPSQLSDTEGRECCRATGRSPCPSCQPSQYHPPHMNMDGYGCQPSQYHHPHI